MPDPVNNNRIKISSWLQFIIIALSAVIVVYISSFLSFRVDLTEDKRFTLSQPGRDMLSRIKNDIYIQVYLDGEMPILFKRLKRSVREMLDEIRIASDRKIDFEFINPSEGHDINERNAQHQALMKKGINPVILNAGDSEGGISQKIIFPGMIVNYNNIEIPVNFLKNNPSIPPELNLLHSVEGLEYEMIQTISTLCSDTVYKVAFIEGHDEIPEIEVADITLNLARFFTVDRGIIGGKTGILEKYSAIIIAGPEKEFDEKDKLVIDQYIMNGGKVLWLAEEVMINRDSLMLGETEALYRPLNIEDQLFRYGARINPAVVQDLVCQIIQLKVIGSNNRQQLVPAPWIYYPLLNPVSNHPITRNINKVKGEFVNYIDTVGFDPRIRKKILLSTSAFSRIVTPPLVIRLKEAEMTPDEKEFRRSYLPVAVLFEGTFTSAFRNRMTGNLVADPNFKIRTESKETKMIVVSDGDIIRNDVSRIGKTEAPYPLGQDKYTDQVFGNKDFLINCLNYLVDDNGIMELRSRELKLRLLDKTRVKQEKLKWQLINLVGPVLIVILSGLLYGFFRRRTFTIY
jgi:ABC-2 type transport system permease protein